MVNPDAFALLMWLRSTEGPFVRFMILNAQAERFEWTVKRFARARQSLIELGYIRLVKPAYTGHPGWYEWND